MEAFGQIAAIWIAAVWIVGALVITAFLAWLVLGYIEDWARNLTSDYKTLGLNIWLYRAVRAFDKTHPLKKKDYYSTEPKKRLEQLCRDVIALAEETGYVVTIETRPSHWFVPEIGKYEMSANVRESRARYQGTFQEKD